MQLTKNQIKQVKELQEKSDLEIDLLDFLPDTEAKNIDELNDYLNEAEAFENETIYYANAMDYLKENDPSLCNSIEEAYNRGFNPKTWNSELLASLLSEKENREAYEFIVDDLEKILFD